MKQLKEFRRNKGFTIKDMCRKIGVSKSYYEKVEYGIREAGKGFIKKFQQAFPEDNVLNMFF